MKITLEAIKRKSPEWFDRGAMKSMRDVGYKTMVGKITGRTYLVATTYGLVSKGTLRPHFHFRVNPILNSREVDWSKAWRFETMGEVISWLENN
jgi:hypothetical protein